MSSKLAKILYGEANAQVLAAQKKVFETAGYTIETAVGRQAIENAVARSAYDLVILGHTLTRDDRHHLPYMAKKVYGGTSVLVLHASGKHPAVDIAIDSRDGERAVLQAVAQALVRRDAKRLVRAVAA
jgi:DNA-binding NtrC family response regulator